MRDFGIILILQIVASCAPQMTKISSRSPDLFEKEKDKDSQVGGPISGPTPELYVKEARINIQPAFPETSSGSLASPDDDRLHLFTDLRPAKVGRHINVLVATNKGAETKANSENKDPNDPKSDEKGTAGQNDKKTDALEEELLKDLPDLKPADKGSNKLLKQFKMQVMHRSPNGDLLARIARTSANPDSQEEFVAEARIPAERLVSGDPITTEDLVDVTIRENHGGELVERRSTSWEDEYSLRLSGFTEAKSRAGLDLEEKRKELSDTRDRLEQKIKAFTAEKRQFVSQRDQLKNEGLKAAGKAQALNQSPNVPGGAQAQGPSTPGGTPGGPAPDSNAANADSKTAPAQPSKGEGNG